MVRSRAWTSNLSNFSRTDVTLPLRSYEGELKWQHEPSHVRPVVSLT